MGAEGEKGRVWPLCQVKTLRCVGCGSWSCLGQSYEQSTSRMFTKKAMMNMELEDGTEDLTLPVDICQGVVFPDAGFKPETDAAELHAALLVKGCDESKIISILTKRSNSQRRQVAEAYQKAFSKDLNVDLKKHLKGGLEDVVLCLLKHPSQFDADELYRSMKGLGTDEDSLIEILVSRTNQQIRHAAKIYELTYKHDLVKMIRSETSGDFRKLIVSLAEAERCEMEPLSLEQAEMDARTLYQDTVQKKGTNLETFNQIFALRSIPNLKQVMQCYDGLSNNPLDVDIAKEVKNTDVKKTLIGLANFSKSPSGYFADKLFENIKGGKSHVLNRIMVSRCEVDMLNIRKEFKIRHGQSLKEALTKCSKGDHQAILLALCGGDD
uniref:annexin A2-like isoform X2 n=1 Tax=Myxine glutinosa TaxID=7769 RepID=UPI00358F74E9